MSIRVNHIRGTTAEVEAATPQMAELGFDTSKNEPHIGNNATQGGIRLAKKNVVETLVAAQLNAGADDYSPAGLKHAGKLVISSDAARTLSGLVATTVTEGTDGRTIEIYNAGGFNITLKDQGLASAAANRFDLNGSDLVLSPKSSATLRYRNGVSRWELVAQTAGAAVAAAAVIARTLAASSQGHVMVNGALAASVAGNALTIAIKTLSGNDPSAVDPVHVLVPAGGGFAMVSLTAATSLVVSAGSSLGSVNGAAFRLWVVGINDAGTFRLGVVNALRGSLALPVLKPDRPVTATAEGGAGGADNLFTVYADAGVVDAAYTPLGYLDWSNGLAAAGSWSAGPDAIELYRAGLPLPGADMAIAAVASAGRVTGMANGAIVESHAGNAVTFAIKTAGGRDPSSLDPVRATFQTGAGGYVVREITAALSLTISPGSTLGFVNNEASRAWLVLIDTGAGVVLGAVNCRSGTSITGLLDSVAYTTTAEGGAGAADAAQVIYSAAAQAAKYVCIAGYADYDAGLAVAGTWAVAPSRIVLFGPNTPRPGELAGNRARVELTTVATGSTVIPADDTIPQSTEGDQYLSKVITPTAAQNLLRVKSQAMAATATAGSPTIALFRDASANASAVSQVTALGGAGLLFMGIDALLLAGSVSQTTFKIRIGPDASQTITVGGFSGTRRFGGVGIVMMDIEEIMG